MLSRKLIKEVMREWSWKVPTGMPDITKASHLQILREVLINDFKLSAYNVDKILEALSKSKYINLSYAAMAMKKTTQFNGFLKSITTEAGNLIEPTLNKLEAEQKKLEKTNKGLKPNNKKYTVGKQCQEFFNILYSVNKVESLKKIPSSGLASTIFNLGGGTGMPGKGEVWASIMVPKTVVSGTSKSYDLSSPGGNYEVKDNRTGGSIRLGVHASLEKFDWWKEIVKTSNTVKDILSNTDLISVLQPLYGASALNLISALENVNSRIGATVGKGAFGKKDIDYHNVFFQVANTFGTSNVQGYTEIQFHGPNRSKIVRSISPLEKSNIPNTGDVSISLLDSKPEQMVQGLRTKLNSLKYVRNPEAFEEDRNLSVTQVADSYAKYNAVFMIFRGSKIHYVDPYKFTYKESSQGKIKVTYPGY